MIDNSISDPTKQIWIDLKLHFETSEFSLINLIIKI